MGANIIEEKGPNTYVTNNDEWYECMANTMTNVPQNAISKKKSHAAHENAQEIDFF